MTIVANAGTLQVAALGYVFTARSIGYLFGSMVGGPLFDRFDGNKLLAAGITLTAIGLSHTVLRA